MAEIDDLLSAISNEFLQPTMVRLSDQLQRHIKLSIFAKMAALSVETEVNAGPSDLVVLDGCARIVASDTAITGRYKYDLQCIFLDDGLHGFSGVRMNGIVLLSPERAENNYSGFTYTYNDWAWGRKFRDF